MISSNSGLICGNWSQGWVFLRWLRTQNNQSSNLNWGGAPFDRWCRVRAKKEQNNARKSRVEMLLTSILSSSSGSCTDVWLSCGSGSPLLLGDLWPWLADLALPLGEVSSWAVGEWTSLGGLSPSFCDDTWPSSGDLGSDLWLSDPSEAANTTETRNNMSLNKSVHKCHQPILVFSLVATFRLRTVFFPPCFFFFFFRFCTMKEHFTRQQKQWLDLCVQQLASLVSQPPKLCETTTCTTTQTGWLFEEKKSLPRVPKKF